MPRVSDIKQLIQHSDTHGDQHLLIMIDHSKNISAYCYYTPGVFAPSDLGAVHNLFDVSFAVLSETHKTHLTSSYVGVLDYIGPFTITLVEKDQQGHISIKDATKEPVSNHLGIGG